MDSAGSKVLTVWVDLCHIPQYNFYRPTIERLSREGHRVEITVLRRGRLPRIVRSEIGHLPGVGIYEIGVHKMTRLSAIWSANIVRNVLLAGWLRGRRIDVGLSNGYAVAMFGALKGFRTYSFDDDPLTIDYRPKLWWNTECNFCIYSAGQETRRLDPRAHILPVLKEWAYLGPSFVPDPAAPDKYGLKPRTYLFCREVSVGTVNYALQSSGAVCAVSGIIPKGMKVLLSLEEKSRRDQYPKDWILLQEPVPDIHSLIYYSAGLVSSGDSMAREAALLGVPSYYLGVRTGMSANLAAASVARLDSSVSRSFDRWVGTLDVSPEEADERQRQVRAHISEEFIDINSYIYGRIVDGDLTPASRS